MRRYFICTSNKELSDSLKRYLYYVVKIDSDSFDFEELMEDDKAEGKTLNFKSYTGALIEVYQEIKLQRDTFLHNTGIGVFCSLKINRKNLFYTIINNPLPDKFKDFCFKIPFCNGLKMLEGIKETEGVDYKKLNEIFPSQYKPRYHE